MSTRRWIAVAALILPIAASAVESYKPGSPEDPQVRFARYLDASKRHFSALIELGQLVGSTDPNQLSVDYQWRLADNYLGFAMHDRAEAMYRSLAARAPDPESYARAQLRLAEFEFQRAYYAEASATLNRIRAKLPKEMLPEWQDLMTRVLLGDGRYTEAADLLLKQDNASDQSPFTRYNLAIALLSSGRTAQAQSILDRLGSMRPDTEEELALRDRANLTLGWHFLQSQQGGTAKPILSRVRVEGPFSNRALLGLGWAELAPQGLLNPKAATADEKPADGQSGGALSSLGALLRPGFLDKKANIGSFKASRANPESEAALKRALVAWVELTQRDPMDPAVQEAWLAIPYALDTLGAHTQALQYYEKAVATLEEGRKRMTAAHASIRQGRMVETLVRREVDAEAGWDWRVADLPDAPETYFLQSLLAEHRFQEGLKNYRDLRMLARNIESWRARLEVIERAYQKNASRPTDIDALIKRELRDRNTPYVGTKVELRLDSTLAAPDSYKNQAADGPAPTLGGLKFAGAPTRFDGSYERVQSLKSRMGNLRTAIQAATTQQAAQLQSLATTELDGQRKQIEKYLVEARFALARLYDRQQKGELDRD